MSVHNFLHVADAENLAQFVDNVGQTNVEVWTDNVIKELQEEGVAAGHKVAGFVAGKVIGGGVAVASNEEAINQGLGVHVGKFGGFKVVNKELFHHPVDTEKLFAFIVFMIEVFNDIIPDTAGSAAHNLG
ncbi:MAG: hypothetical protein BWX67_02338 [Thermotogae bacterium ADurb.Bin062]|nr:MAG: hypothetical protein BWX67_02338 [Thermotogota bacterium ADurb.Bin062]